MEVLDCAEAMIHLVANTSESLNCYNLGSGDSCSVRRIAEIVVEESGLPGVEIHYTGGDRGWAGDVPKAMLAVNALESTGFRCRYDSERSVAHTARVLLEEIGLQ